MSICLVSVFTRITFPVILNALLAAWPTDPVHAPTRASVSLAADQMAVETGLDTCRDFNVSGIKARVGGSYDWQFFDTTEYYTPAQLADAKTKGPLTVLSLQTDGRTKVMLHPQHPYCAFRAFADMQSAVTDHIATLQHNFPHAWEALQTGNPERFASGLHEDHYYTAPESEYAKALRFRDRQQKAIMRKYQGPDLWGDVQ